MRLLFAILIVFYSSVLFSNQYARLNCLSLGTAGAVNIEWTAVSNDCSSFTSYEIYFSNSNIGAYNLIQTITDKNISSYNHSTANAHLSAKYYFIKTISACGEFYSDTLKTIYLDVTNPGNSRAQLDWNSILNMQNTYGYYYIYKNYPAGTIRLIDSVPNNVTTYNQDIYTCNKYIAYQVGIKNNSGCISKSNFDGENFQDGRPPITPNIDSVSVLLSNGKVVISWQRPSSPDIAGYIVYLETNGAWIGDTVYGANTTSYIKNASNAIKYAENYRVAAFDTCRNVSPMSSLHKTIYAFPYYDECLAEIKLEWNHYVGWNDNILEYEIFLKNNDGTNTFLGTVAGNTRTFIHPNLSGNTQYCYYVRATSGDGTKTSTSNLSCLTTQASSNPNILNADYASIIDYNQVELSFTIDTAADIKYFKLMRSDKIDGVFTEVDRINNDRNVNITFVDYLQAQYDINYYKIVANNKCDIDIKSSNIANNIILNVFNTSNLKHTLRWNTYENWLGNVEKYNVYRMVDDGLPQLIGFSYNGSTGYIDDISKINLSTSSGKYCYYIEAIEGDNNPYGIKGISRSNISCAEQFPRVFIPTAFTPDNNGVNDILYPSVTFASPVDYKFTIYNRWGDVVFFSTNPLEGWNGYYEGNRCPAGVYAYHISFSTAENKSFVDSGTITIYLP